jgi:heterodisulfide reductase subunit A
MTTANGTKPSNDSNPRIGVYVCRCGLNIAKTVDCEKVAQTARNIPDVVVSKDITYACSEPGQTEIREDIRDHGLDRIVVASCSPRLHEPTFRQMMKQADLNPFLLEMANLREQCSWVHINEPEAATRKAEDLVKMEKFADLVPLIKEQIELLTGKKELKCQPYPILFLLKFECKYVSHNTLKNDQYLALI